MVNVEAFKTYVRFLKEHGMYNITIKAHLNALKNWHNVTSPVNVDVLSQFLYEAGSPIYYMSSQITIGSWARTKEGEAFWWAKNIQWVWEALKRGLVSGHIISWQVLIIKDGIDTLLHEYESMLASDDVKELKNILSERLKIRSELEKGADITEIMKRFYN